MAIERSGQRMTQRVETGELIKFSPGLYAVCSDLHIGSPYFAKDKFTSFVEAAKQRGAKTILNAGDLFEVNDLMSGRVSLQDYLQNVADVSAILGQNDLKVQSVSGNQDDALKNHFGSVFTQARDILGNRVQLFDTPSVTINIGGKKVILDHYAEQTNNDQNALVIGGHSHMPKTRTGFVNPGGFRNHFRDDIAVGGLFIDFNANGSDMQIERWGDKTPDQERLIANLKELDMHPEVLYLPEDFAAYPMATEFLKRIRAIDPQSVMWLTGSRARDDTDESIGVFTGRYKLLLGKDGNPKAIEAEPQEASVLSGAVSDVDIEFISSTVTKDQLTEIVTDVMKTPAFGDKPLLVEASCYRPEDIPPYLSMNADQDIQNFFVYRMLLAPTRVVDEQSLNGVQKLIDTALPLFEAQAANIGFDLNEHAAVRGYFGYQEFKRIKHLLKKGNLTRVEVSPGTYLADYLSAKAIDAPRQTQLPSALDDTGSFKIVVPDYYPHGLASVEMIRNGSTDETKDKMVTPPLTAYTENIHFGQVMSVFIGSVLSRYSGRDYNPFTFQVTGPYWDNTNYSSSEIPGVIEHNTGSVMETFNQYGIDGPVHRDDDEQNLRVFDSILKRWEGLGLILNSDDSPELKLGSALMLFGGLDIFKSTNSANLQGLIEQYMRDGHTEALYPRHGSTRYTVMREGVPYYPTYTLLGLPHAGEQISTRNIAVTSGENVATQFGLGHAVAIKSLNAATEVAFTETNLVTDAHGKRMTRLANNVVYEADLMDLAREQDARFQKEVVHTEDELRFAVMFGVLNHVSVGNHIKFNPEKIGRGLRVLNRLQISEKKLLASGSIGQIDVEDLSTLDERFKRYLDEHQVGKASQYYYDKVHTVTKRINAGSGTIEDYADLLQMTWVLFGDFGISMIKNK